MRTLILALFICPFLALGQSASTYWQQKLKYSIDARLDTACHQIHGHLELSYQNNSPDTLHFIWFHLWPKAYSSKKSEFAKRKAESGNTEFHFAPKNNWGDMDSLLFTSGGSRLIVEPHSKWIDVVKVKLNTPIPPGGTSIIQTPFRTTIPTNFSRLGREGNAYQISQWYPKPAVYDRKGWHPMPYLDQGEFYSEFGSFNVKITVPAAYLVAATGDCLTLAENQLTDALIAGEQLVAPTGQRSFEYSLDNIHDFAWFADPSFKICSKEFSLPSGKKVTAKAYYKKENEKEWQYGCEYLERSIRWYSEKVGEYPYSVVSAVDGALKAGGGMEYPTITVIGEVGDTSSLEQVILHEVGHNWFYGILGSQERRYPWMDEGINSYYENLYTRKKSEAQCKDTGDTIKPSIRFNGRALSLGMNSIADLTEVAWVHTARQGNALPAASASDHYSQIGYGVVVYGYSARLMDYLEAWMGTELFDKAIQEYFRRWSFKHPYPEDLQAVLEEISGKKLSWFFEGIVEQGDAPDFRIKNFKHRTQELVLSNNSRMGAPVQVSWMNGKEKVKSTWTEPFIGSLSLTEKTDLKFTHIQLNADKRIPDINSKNNIVYNRTAFKRYKPLKISVLPIMDRIEHFPIYVFPIVGGNTTDGLMTGLWISNQVLPSPRFRYTIMPVYGFRSKELLGSIYLRKDFIPRSGALSKIQASYSQDAYAGLLRAKPQITFYGRRRDHNRSLQSELSLGWNMVWTQPSELSYLPQRYDVGEATASLAGGNKMRSWKVQTSMRWQPEHFLLWENTLSGKLRYLKSDAIHWRAYTGYFINRDQIHPAFRLGLSGSSDYLMNQVFLDRAMTSAAYRGIINQTDGLQGGFASWNPIWSDQWLHAINLRVDLPYMPFQIYGDVANFQYAGFLPWDAGFTLKVIPDIWEFYFPVMGSQYNGKMQSFRNYGTQIRFLLKLNLLAPDKLSQRLR